MKHMYQIVLYFKHLYFNGYFLGGLMVLCQDPKNFLDYGQMHIKKKISVQLNAGKHNTHP